jgi:hypothetical protein
MNRKFTKIQPFQKILIKKRKRVTLQWIYMATNQAISFNFSVRIKDTEREE